MNAREQNGPFSIPHDVGPTMKRQRVDHHGCFRLAPCCGAESATSEADVGSGAWATARNPGQHTPRSVDDEIGRMLAADMNSLTLEDRGKVFEDIHGIREPPPETDEFVSEQLHQLEEEIQKVPWKPAYDEARSSAPNYVTNRDFCLMFLRGQEFHAKRAARQIVDHFQMKKDLFGSSSLGRPIELRDLSEGAVRVLEDGAIQMLKKLDASGRQVIFIAQRVLYQTELVESLRGAIFYLYMSLLEDVQVQKKGCVAILWSHGVKFEFTLKNFLFWQKGTEVAYTMPLRTVACHRCAPGGTFDPLLDVALRNVISKYQRLRHKIHGGSMIENLYALGSFGIQRNDLPVDDNGNIRAAEEWVENRRLKENAMIQTKASGASVDNYWPELAHLDLENVPGDIPGPHDILMGERTIEVKQHLGNIYYRQLVAEKVLEYNATRSTKVKGRIRDYVIEKLRELGGRFLSREGGQGWREIDDERLVQKRVNQAFRNYRRKSEGGDVHSQV